MTVPEVENFRPVADVLSVERRDFPVADKTLTNPTNAVVLTDGEWMTLNASRQLIRAADVATPDDPATGPSFPLWAEQGRYDVQAIADRKTPVLWLGSWEFETLVFDPAAVVGSGAAITALLQPLKVATITIGTRNYVGIVGHGGAGTDSDPIVAYVTNLHSANGGWLGMRGGLFG